MNVEARLTTENLFNLHRSKIGGDHHVKVAGKEMKKSLNNAFNTESKKWQGSYGQEEDTRFLIPDRPVRVNMYDPLPVTLFERE